MSWKIRRASAAVSTELAISIGLAAVVLIVALGLFNDNVQAMISNSSIADIFNGNASKTLYSSFNRDYSDSEVETQMTGEQGLQMIRKTANNKAIEQIADEFSGVDTSLTNANSIGYLALAIEAIVGSPDVCVYMKKNSDKLCNEDEIGGFKYKLSSTSASKIKITDVDTNKSISITPASTILAKTIDNSRKDSKAKFDFIKTKTKDVKDSVYSKVLLVNVFEEFKTNLVYIYKQMLTNALGNLKASVHEARTHCYIDSWPADIKTFKKGCSYYKSGSGSNGSIGVGEEKDVKKWIKNMNKKISAYNGSPEGLVNIILNDSDLNEIIDIISDDHTQTPTACQSFVDSINSYLRELNSSRTISCQQ